jgi:hypothetical protein
MLDAEGVVQDIKNDGGGCTVEVCKIEGVGITLL